MADSEVPIKITKYNNCIFLKIVYLTSYYHEVIMKGDQLLVVIRL